MQNHNNLLEIFINPLNRLGVRYMVTGSVASICYGEPRLTHDVDLVVMLTSDDIKRLPEEFPDNDYYLPPKEVIISESRRSTRGHFNIIHMQTALKADVYFVGNEPVQLWGFKNRREVEVEGLKVYLASPEYVIVKKLQYWHEGRHNKHLDDIRAMLSVVGPELKIDEIQSHLSADLFAELNRLINEQNKN